MVDWWLFGCCSYSLPLAQSLGVFPYIQKTIVTIDPFCNCVTYPKKLCKGALDPKLRDLYENSCTSSTKSILKYIETCIVSFLPKIWGRNQDFPKVSVWGGSHFLKCLGRKGFGEEF